MASKTLNARIVHKIDTIENYRGDNCLIPFKGEIIIAADDLSTNDTNEPYIVKIGDGNNSWDNLPAIGPAILIGQEATQENVEGDENQEITIKISAETKTYATYKFQDGDDKSFIVNVVYANQDRQSYLLAEHYLLLDNSGTGVDRYFKGVNIEGIEDDNIFVQYEYVSANDITELKFAIYQIDDVRYATVTSKSGIVNGGRL